MKKLQKIQKIVVAGGGVLGTQIAFQSAFYGFDVTIFLRSPESIQRTKPKLERLYHIYLAEVNHIREQLKKGEMPLIPRGFMANIDTVTLETTEQWEKQIEAAYHKIHLSLTLSEAVRNADLIIESIAENPDAKIEFYSALSPHLDPHTIVATNTSTMVPSQFRDCIDRPERYLALHFANNIWRNNTAEVMGHDGTRLEIFNEVTDFAEAIGMIPLRLMKEQPGYILNTMLVPFLEAAQGLLANDVADPKTIDLTWRLGSGSPLGPFQIIDIIGLDTAYNVIANKPDINDETSLTYKIAFILRDYIKAGKTGVNAGEGFYRYT